MESQCPGNIGICMSPVFGDDQDNAYNKKSQISVQKILYWFSKC